MNGKMGQPMATKTFDLYSLPPCRKSLIQHIHRTTYPMTFRRETGTPVMIIPSTAVVHGWTKMMTAMLILFIMKTTVYSIS